MNRRPRPAADEIHLYTLPLPDDPAALARLAPLLSADETARAARLLDRRRRDRWRAGRALLRRTLAGYLEQGPAQLRFGYGAHGKPFLAGEEGPHGLRFNLSHAGELLLLAVTVNDEVGIDLEWLEEGVAFEEMARRFFSAREREELFDLPAVEQRAAFYRCWTRKEAYLKGCGSGFTQPADRFDVTLRPGEPPALVAHRGDPGEAGRWRLADLPVPPGYCAALATPGERRLVRCAP